MKKYIARRILLFVPTLLGVAIVIFLLLRVLPGDPAEKILAGPYGEGTFTQDDVERLREQLGLDKPIHEQFATWILDLVKGDLGYSVAKGRPVADELKRQFPVSLQLGLLSIALIWSIAIPIGVLAAVRQDSWVDYVFRGIAIMGLAMPTFFVGLLIILVLSRFFNWLPPFAFTHIWDSPSIAIQQLIFPAIALGFSTAGTLLRMTRTQLLEVLREDYIRTARSKGLSQGVVTWRHAVRNSLLPVVTIAGAQIGLIFSGTVVIERIFNIPGVGRGLLEALSTRDLLMIQTYVMYFAFIALAANLLVDLTYAWLDPRIRYD
jgi:peptide/nickel transport system permease protein